MREDVLGILWRVEERQQTSLQVSKVAMMIHANPILLKFVLNKLMKTDDIAFDGPCVQLTSKGRQRASLLVRSHRLWEVYLDKHFPQDQHQLHHAASRLEHVTTEEMQSELSGATHDPHGSKVPDSLDE